MIDSEPLIKKSKQKSWFSVKLFALLVVGIVACVAFINHNSDAHAESMVAVKDSSSSGSISETPVNGVKGKPVVGSSGSEKPRQQDLKRGTDSTQQQQQKPAHSTPQQQPKPEAKPTTPQEQPKPAHSTPQEQPKPAATPTNPTTQQKPGTPPAPNSQTQDKGKKEPGAHHPNEAQDKKKPTTSVAGDDKKAAPKHQQAHQASNNQKSKAKPKGKTSEYSETLDSETNVGPSEADEKKNKEEEEKKKKKNEEEEKKKEDKKKDKDATEPKTPPVVVATPVKGDATGPVVQATPVKTDATTPEPKSQTTEEANKKPRAHGTKALN